MMLILAPLLINTVYAFNSTYQEYVLVALDYLQSTWYDNASGVYDGIGWWGSANCITTIADFAALDPGDAGSRSISNTLLNTYNNAPSTNPDSPEYSGFLGDANDDEGWWALALIHAYDVTGNTDFLAMAETIFTDMTSVENAYCGGGIAWMKTNDYVNAIANELYLTVAAALANRVSDDEQKQNYTNIAVTQWNWFINQDFFNSIGQINDGLSVLEDGTCVNNGQSVWTYNQGVIIGGLIELIKTGGGTESDLLPYAINWANLTMQNMVENGILRETACEPSCDSNQVVFKGKPPSSAYLFGLSGDC